MSFETFNYSVLCAALRRKNARIVAMLVGVVPLDADAITPLICEAASVGVEVIQKLVERGIVIRQLHDILLRTPLFSATDERVMDALVNACGIDLNAVDAGGNAAVHAAVWRNNSQLMRWAINAGADLEVKNRSGHTPLHSCCRGVPGTNGTMLLLLAAGVELHAVDMAGMTACQLMVTRLSASAEIVATNVSALMAAGADIDAPFPFQNGTSTARERLAARSLQIGSDAVEEQRRCIAKLRLDLVRQRAFDVCVGLQSRELDALQLCEILLYACGPCARLIHFHQWWAIATAVKHFHR